MQTTCGFGHLYDSEQYASCPYCNRGTRALYFGRSGSQKTTSPRGGVPNQERTPYERTTAPSIGYHQSEKNIEKTTMPESLRQKMDQERQNKTVGIFKKKYGMEPVVGWLVCIEGAEKGKDYRLYNRINTIGRSEENDVVLAFENTVSQKNHARLAYDSKHNIFQMIPGDGHNIIYLNEAPLYVPQTLAAYDVVEFGDTKLLFIPLCSERFQWQEEGQAQSR